jgi:hypothetical protein
MQLVRPPHAMHPRLFGRGRVRLMHEAAPGSGGLSIGPDLRLFATTFVAGFLFVSILLG